MSKFVPNPGGLLSTGNYVLKGKDFFISFNPNPGGMINSLMVISERNMKNCLIKASTHVMISFFLNLN